MILINDKLLQSGRLIFAYRPPYYDEKKISESDLHDIIRPYIILATYNNDLICCTLTSKTDNKRIIFKKSKYKALAYNSSPQNSIYKISKKDITFVTENILSDRDLQSLNYLIYRSIIDSNNNYGNYHINEYFIELYLKQYPINSGEIISFKDGQNINNYFVVDIKDNKLVTVKLIKDDNQLYHILDYNLVYFDINIRYHRRFDNFAIKKCLFNELKDVIEDIDDDIICKKLIKKLSD